MTVEECKASTMRMVDAYGAYRAEGIDGEDWRKAIELSLGVLVAQAKFEATEEFMATVSAKGQGNA